MTFGSFESIQPKSNLFHTSSEAVFNWEKNFQKEHSYFHKLQYFTVIKNHVFALSAHKNESRFDSRIWKFGLIFCTLTVCKKDDFRTWLFKCLLPIDKNSIPGNILPRIMMEIVVASAVVFFYCCFTCSGFHLRCH